MKAIETKYKGYRFRSRLEARWAVFFDTLGVKWEYEPQGFEFHDGTRYLPDFWLPDLKLFLEIKGAAPTEDEFRKAENLRDGGFSIAIAQGLPGERDLVLYCWMQKDGAAGTEHKITAEFACFGRSLILHATGYFSSWYTLGGERHCCANDVFDYLPVFGEILPDWDKNDALKMEQAYTAARSARFEFGERGIPSNYLDDFESIGKGVL